MKEKTPPASYWKDNVYYVLDQLKLPREIFYIECRTPSDIAQVIIDMNLRGAPLIGAAASAGVALFFLENSSTAFYETKDMLLKTRPTAVNLRNVLDEAVELFEKNKELSKENMFMIFQDFSQKVHSRDYDRNHTMGEIGAQYISERFNGRKLNILTHCNAGALATCGYGTALGIVRSLNSRGMIENVWVDETRPYLQGSRITAFEMESEDIPHRIITDSTAAWLMHRKMVDIVITGADRVACNGDLANKIGTYSLAVNAAYHNIPYVSAMPVETFDLSIEEGSEIVIEERPDSELLEFNGIRTAPEGSSGLHLGFDVVPAVLTTAIITERGVISPVSKSGVMEMIDG